MNELDLILAKSNLSIVREQLDAWNKSKPNDRASKMSGMVLHTEIQFNALEKEYRIARQRTSDLEIKALLLHQENEQMKQTIENLISEIELHKKE